MSFRCVSTKGLVCFESALAEGALHLELSLRFLCDNFFGHLPLHLGKRLSEAGCASSDLLFRSLNFVGKDNCLYLRKLDRDLQSLLTE
jgi:hypothetical protein